MDSLTKNLTALLVVAAVGQSLAISPAELTRLKPKFISKYEEPNSKIGIKELRMEFNEFNILNVGIIPYLKNRAIKKVTLYYSQYKLSQGFDQPSLNLKRFEELKRLFPSLLENNLIDWKIICQNSCSNAQDAKKLFHGFVIEYIPEATTKSIATEIKSIKKIALSDSLGKDTLFYSYKMVAKRKVKWSGNYKPVLARKRKQHIIYTERSIWNRKKEFITIVDSVKVKTQIKRFKPSTYAITFANSYLNDTTLFSVLNRNQQWKDMVFIVDVTGSMGSYTNQLFIWFKLNSHKRSVQSFTFFNDGDMKSDDRKKVGNTKGIYSIDAASTDAVIRRGLDAMSKGGGGDAPENNCEAVLETIKTNPNIKEVYMIADNWANMRDTALISKIKIPVHIIMCGVYDNYINVEYLNLAKRTGGSIHTLNQDIENLMKYSEGDKIKINGKEYFIQGGKFMIYRDIRS